MKDRLIQFLACPACASDLLLKNESRDGTEIMEGDLLCVGCGRRFPVTRGVPRLLPDGLADLAREVADGFGWQWNTFDSLHAQYRQQFLDWMRPLVESDFRGKRVLEGGCGKGRHSTVVAEFGATDVFAVDLGSAVEAAFRNCRHLDAVHVIQADLTHLPLKRCADVGFSIGVVHHMPIPEDGVRGIADHIVPGGRIALWVYGYENNEWIVNYVDPIRKQLTSQMSRPWLYKLSAPVGWAIAALAKGVYKPLSTLAPPLHAQLFYKEYITYIANLTTREIHNIVFDQLVTPVAYYLKREEVAAWFNEARYSDVEIEHHNANSWRVTALVADGEVEKVPKRRKANGKGN